MIKNIVLALAMGFSTLGISAPENSVASAELLKQNQKAPVLLAQSSKRDRKAKKRYLQGEARSSASKTSIDFDAASIDGERRTPVGVQVGGTKQENGYNLINLRLRWHPEMIKSTSNLETGKSQ